jgi:hypothetical protein
MWLGPPESQNAMTDFRFPLEATARAVSPGSPKPAAAPAPAVSSQFRRPMRIEASSLLMQFVGSMRGFIAQRYRRSGEYTPNASAMVDGSSAIELPTRSHFSSFDNGG